VRRQLREELGRQQREGGAGNAHIIISSASILVLLLLEKKLGRNSRWDRRLDQVDAVVVV
jgi:hypothetical protein